MVQFLEFMDLSLCLRCVGVVLGGYCVLSESPFYIYLLYSYQLGTSIKMFNNEY